mmetsp:Transcript_180/g.255  ORF Transcript_180/g.255 Transcript_180/m.255 type:complete len:82 (-) Transcript_180:233-478(-)
MRSWRWRQSEINKNFVQTEFTENVAGDKTVNASKGVAYRSLIHGWGEGTPLLDKTLELQASLNAYAFVSLIKEEYVNAIDD